MALSKSGDLICDCCGRIVVKADEVNKNGRLYPKEVVKDVIKKYEKEFDHTICHVCWKVWQTIQPETD